MQKQRETQEGARLPISCMWTHPSDLTSSHQDLPLMVTPPPKKNHRSVTKSSTHRASLTTMPDDAGVARRV